MEFLIKLFTICCRATNEFVIHHDKLQKYGVINKITTTNNIKRCLEQFDLIEYEVYRLLNVEQPVKQGGFSYKNISNQE